MDVPDTANDRRPVAEELSDWDAVTNAFDSFRPPRIDFDQGGIKRTSWIFRGHKCASYRLDPSIEREAKGKKSDWAALESIVLNEFQVKSSMHMDVSRLPPPSGQTLAWLATAQHYGVPTRLLDFTYSPYVALYFAIRGQDSDHKSAPAAVWAIDAEAILAVARSVSVQADEQEGIPEGSERDVPDSLLGLATDADSWEWEGRFWAKALTRALQPTVSRREFYKKGFVAFALPPVENRRLSSQQGAFLLNGAQGLPFEESLFKMMQDYERPWCRLFHLPAAIRVDIENKLFQMNIHELSLFPDIEGLAGFIRQKTRLHWMPVSSD